jgi:hypothetical protein
MSTVGRVRSVALIAATLGMAAIATAPLSVATVDLYLKEVRAKVAAHLTDAQALQLGNVACGALRAGVEKGLSFGKARHEADQADTPPTSLAWISACLTACFWSKRRRTNCADTWR